jgi:cobalt-zinc-cadmium resistance protein CzcA
VVATRGGVPVRVKDVGQVVIGGAVRTGSGSLMGSEAVISTVLMLVGENSRVVANRASDKLAEVNRALPPDVFAEPVYNRSKLVNATIATVSKNLVEGALLVIVVLFLLLGNIRAALITAAVIPVTMLMTASGMNGLGVSGNLMSLGALDFGLIVDGAVIVVENTLRHLAERQEHEGRLLTLKERMEETIASATAMVRPTVYGQLIIFLVFVPLLTFQGVEGKTFSPMAITLMIALASAFVLSITFVPAMTAILISGGSAKARSGPCCGSSSAMPHGWRRPWQGPCPSFWAGPGCLSRRCWALACWVRSSCRSSTRRTSPSPFPRALRLDRPVDADADADRECAEKPARGGAGLFQERQCRSGHRPHAAQRLGHLCHSQTREGVACRCEEQGGYPPPHRGEDEAADRQPDRDPAADPDALQRADRGRARRCGKLYGDDLDQMTVQAQHRRHSAQDPRRGRCQRRADEGAPTFDVKIDRMAAARFGLSVQEVADTVASALGGREAGLLFEGDRRFAVVVRLPDVQRDDLEVLGSIPSCSGGRGQIARSIPLREVARFSYTQGLNQISRENGKRMVTVQVNVRGRDLGGFVKEAQRKVGPRSAAGHVHRLGRHL